MSADRLPWDEGRVLRLLPEHWTDEQIHHEFAGADAAWRSGAPVVGVYGIEMAKGRVGIIEDVVTGSSMLDVLSARPWKAQPMGRLLGELHTRMLTLRAPDDLVDVKEQWAGALQGADVDEDLRRQLLTDLSLLRDGDRLLHGSLEPAHVVLSPSGPIVTDWNAASRGPVEADVAATLVALATALPPSNARLWPLLERGRRRVLQAYRSSIGDDQQHACAPWIPLAATVRIASSLRHQRDALRSLAAGQPIS